MFYKRKQIYLKTPTDLMTNDDNENNNKKENIWAIYTCSQKNKKNNNKKEYSIAIVTLHIQFTSKFL